MLRRMWNAEFETATAFPVPVLLESVFAGLYLLSALVFMHANLKESDSEGTKHF